jgi:Flp pilus assembly protein TadG
MALSIMLLMLILVGIFEFGRAMYTKNTLINASRAGARQAVVTPQITNEGPSTLMSPSNTKNLPIHAAIDKSLVSGFDKSLITVKISGASSPVAPNNTIEVEVKYTGFLSFTKLVPLTNTLYGTTSMRYE